MSQEAAAAAPAAPAKSKKMLIIIVAVLVVAGGGGGAYWKFFAKSADPKAAEAKKKPSEPPAIINFDPFVVNLSDPGTPRFLRVTLGLVVEGEKPAKEFAENAVVRTKVRSSLLEMLSQQQASQLVTPAGKDALKKAIVERAEHNAEELKVNDVLFTEFIVQ
jgi:flagellar FliL protein